MDDGTMKIQCQKRGAENFICRDCDKQWSSAKALVAHRRVHVKSGKIVEALREEKELWNIFVSPVHGVSLRYQRWRMETG